ICLDNTNSHVYVADTGNKRIQVVDRDGKYVNAFGSDYLTEPRCITLCNHSIFVTDEAQHNVIKFSEDGVFILKVGSRGTGQLEFNIPYGIAFEDSLLYICDFHNNRVQILDTELHYINTVKNSHFSSPTTIQVSATAIHVMKQNDNNVYLFSKATNKLLQIIHLTGQEYKMKTHFYFAIDKSGNYLVSANFENCICIFDSEAALRQIIGTGHMEHPTGILVDNNNNIICVTLDANNQFQIY
uniref:NHL repeat-containing protein n=1 Tax=Salmonella sp. s51228 TaxID=3159652 RepID=UPI00397ED146